MQPSEIAIIGTCPDLQKDMTSRQYVAAIESAARQAEEKEWSAMLIYSDHKQFDPWLCANVILSATKRISPLIALQPLYMHPFTAAKLIASLSFLYSRTIYLNIITGGFPWDLETFCDSKTHDERYDRAVEYVEIIRRLLTEMKPITYLGTYYQVDGLQLPSGIVVSTDNLPVFTISGSSPAGMLAARRLGARAIQNLRPSTEYNGVSFAGDIQHGTRLGIIARPTNEEAWKVAHSRYPEDNVGREVRQYNITITDSVWVKNLSKPISVPCESCYWLEPFNRGQAGCPFLVGSIGDVARYISEYKKLGFSTFLVDRHADEEDAGYINMVFETIKHI